jgi:hypothetical protein
VDLGSIDDDSIVTYEEVEYDTPAGWLTKHVEVPYHYSPPASTAPTLSQGNVSIAMEYPAAFGAGTDQEQEQPGPTPAKKRNKVFNFVTHTVAVAMQSDRREIP